MAKPLVVFGDAQAAAAQLLRAALAGRGEAYAAGVEVGDRLPEDRSYDVDRLPYVLVRDDAATGEQWPVNQRSTLRVTVWHHTSDDAHDLAQLCLGLLLVHSGDVLRSVRYGTGVLRGADPDSDVDLASFTVLANVRPTVLAG